LQCVLQCVLQCMLQCVLQCIAVCVAVCRVCCSLLQQNQDWGGVVTYVCTRAMYINMRLSLPHFQHTAIQKNVCCSALQCGAVCTRVLVIIATPLLTHCNTLKHAATRCNMDNTLQQTATNTISAPNSRSNTTISTATRYNTLQHTATALQHTATHCNTLQHTSTPRSNSNAINSRCPRDAARCKALQLLKSRVLASAPEYASCHTCE